MFNVELLVYPAISGSYIAYEIMCTHSILVSRSKKSYEHSQTSFSIIHQKYDDTKINNKVQWTMNDEKRATWIIFLRVLIFNWFHISCSFNNEMRFIHPISRGAVKSNNSILMFVLQGRFNDWRITFQINLFWEFGSNIS